MAVIGDPLPARDMDRVSKAVEEHFDRRFDRLSASMLRMLLAAAVSSALAGAAILWQAGAWYGGVEAALREQTRRIDKLEDAVSRQYELMRHFTAPK